MSFLCHVPAGIFCSNFIKFQQLIVELRLILSILKHLSGNNSCFTDAVRQTLYGNSFVKVIQFKFHEILLTGYLVTAYFVKINSRAIIPALLMTF